MARRERKNQSSRLETRRLLYDGCGDKFDHPRGGGHNQIYNPDFHPGDILDYFRTAYEAMEDPERYTSKGVIGWTMKPVRPPSQVGYAARIGIRPETLWAWEKAHGEFANALAMCKAFQAAMLIESSACGAYHPGSAAMILKNLHGWTDRVEETHKGSVAFVFDADDEEV